MILVVCGGLDGWDDDVRRGRVVFAYLGYPGGIAQSGKLESWSALGRVVGCVAPVLHFGSIRLGRKVRAVPCEIG